MNEKIEQSSLVEQLADALRGCMDRRGDYLAVAEAALEAADAGARRVEACVSACEGIPTEVLAGKGFALADDEAPLYELVAVAP